jgi:hypothetical protein
MILGEDTVFVKAVNLISLKQNGNCEIHHVGTTETEPHFAE